MQDLNQNMDELLRKAAEHYPLKINDSEWEKIAPSIINTAEKPVSGKKNRFIKYTSLFVLFISLLLADGIITRSLKKNGSGQFLHPVAEKKSVVSSSTQNELSEHGRKKKEQDRLALQIPLPATTAGKEDIPIRKTSLLDKKDESTPPTNNQRLKSSFYQTVAANKILNTYKSISPITSDEELTKLFLVVKNKNVPVLKESPPAETILRKIFQQKGLYAGVVAGPLLDEVKNQGLKKTGFSVGVVAGYRFNDHWSVESGLLFAKKPYFSTGKYFSMDKMGSSMPQGMEILSIEGKNVMLEIPVKLKYDFLQRSNHHFFSTAGLSSFINTNEKNNYLVAMNGVQQSMISSYKNRSRSAAATLDFSAGYEFKIGKSGHIRIEPYIQIPLKGMGVGSMPMKSSGIRLGITKFFN